MARKKNPPPEPNPRWKKNSKVSKIYEVLVARHPGRTMMVDIAILSIGGLSRRMNEIRIWLKTQGWDYDNDCHWDPTREEWHSEYWLIEVGV